MKINSRNLNNKFRGKPHQQKTRGGRDNLRPQRHNIKKKWIAQSIKRNPSTNYLLHYENAKSKNSKNTKNVIQVKSTDNVFSNVIEEISPN